MARPRNKGLGGTDIAAILGLNPWKSPIDVYMEKLGITESQDDNESMWWGREMEPVLKKRYEKETNIIVTIPDPQDLPYDGPYPWYLWSPDGLIGDPYNIPMAEGGVDYKTTGRRDPDEWGESGTDHVPPQHLIQAAWYMGASGAQWWDIAVLFMGYRREFAVYRIHRDQELINVLTQKAQEFWENHILVQEPPEPDASPGWKKFFKKKFPLDSGEEMEVSTDLQNTIMLYRDNKHDLKRLEKYCLSVENQIKAAMGTASILKGDFGKMTWKKNRDSTVTDWKTIAEALRDQIPAGLWNQIVKDHTTTVPGPRVLRSFWAKEK